MLPRNQAQQRRQLQIAQIMDLVDEAFIRHRIGPRSPSGPLATLLLQQTEFAMMRPTAGLETRSSGDVYVTWGCTTSPQILEVMHDPKPETATVIAVTLATGPICIAGSSRRTRYRAFDIIGRHASHSLNLAIDGFEPLFRKGHPNGDNTILELCLGG